MTDQPDTASNLAPAVRSCAVMLGDGTKIAALDSGGRGAVVVLCHPHTGLSDSFATQIAVLSIAGVRVIAYDRRSYGRSTGNSADGTMAGDLMELLDALAVRDPVHAVGVAAGSIAAADLALAAPDRVASLFLAGSLMAVTDPDWVQRLAETQRPKLTGRTVAEKELSPRFRRDRPKEAEAWRRIAEENLAAGSGEPPQKTLVPARFAALAALSVPLTVITGSDDLYLPPALLEEARPRLPNARCHVVAECGHAPHVEAAETFNRLVLDSLGR